MPERYKANQVDIHIGQQIRKRRLQLKITMKALSKACGVSYQQMQKYEAGANRISASRLWVIADILQVSIDYFFTSTESSTLPIYDIPPVTDPKLRNSIECVIEYLTTVRG